MKDGGPAFPMGHEAAFRLASSRLERAEIDPEKNPKAYDALLGDYCERFSRGATLRDYFATSALCGMAGGILMDSGYDGSERERRELIARTAYLMADAMLEVREITDE